MKTKSVRIQKLAGRFGVDPSLVDGMLAATWGSMHSVEIIFIICKLTDQHKSEMLDIARFVGESRRRKWVIRNLGLFVDKLTLRAIATIARDAPQGDAILKIVLAGNSVD